MIKNNKKRMKQKMYTYIIMSDKLVLDIFSASEKKFSFFHHFLKFIVACFCGKKFDVGSKTFFAFFSVYMRVWGPFQPTTCYSFIKKPRSKNEPQVDCWEKTTILKSVEILIAWDLDIFFTFASKSKTLYYCILRKVNFDMCNILTLRKIITFAEHNNGNYFIRS